MRAERTKHGWHHCSSGIERDGQAELKLRKLVLLSRLKLKSFVCFIGQGIGPREGKGVDGPNSHQSLSMRERDFFLDRPGKEFDVQ
jgi:hypothetical protein